MKCWWVIKVFDKETNTTTTLNSFGFLDIIKENLASDGLWEFVSAYPEECDADNKMFYM